MHARVLIPTHIYICTPQGPRREVSRVPGTPNRYTVVLNSKTKRDYCFFFHNKNRKTRTKHPPSEDGSPWNVLSFSQSWFVIRPGIQIPVYTVPVYSCSPHNSAVSKCTYGLGVKPSRVFMHQDTPSPNSNTCTSYEITNLTIQDQTGYRIIYRSLQPGFRFSSPTSQT